MKVFILLSMIGGIAALSVLICYAVDRALNRVLEDTDDE